MWVLVAFDLPTDTKEDRRNYNRFRRLLLEHGCFQMQYSVYVRNLVTDDLGRTLKDKIRDNLPPYGDVRVMLFTDRQWQLTENYYCRKWVKPEDPPEQLELF